MGGPAYPPSLTSSRVTLPKVERNTWPAAPQVPQAATSTHSRPVFLSILVHCPRPTHTSEGAAHARAAATSTGCDRRQPTARAVVGSGPTTLQDPPPPLLICSYRSSQGTWMGGQAGCERPPHPEKASLWVGRRWIGCKPEPKIKPYFRPRQPPMPDLICPNVEFDRFRFYFRGTIDSPAAWLASILVVVSGVTARATARDVNGRLQQINSQRYQDMACLSLLRQHIKAQISTNRAAECILSLILYR